MVNSIPFALDLQVGDAVVVPDGRIGMISNLPRPSVAVVQFGAGGPYGRYSTSSLRWATEREVRDAGMYGVGFNIRV
jgi:hypothetical protein